MSNQLTYPDEKTAILQDLGIFHLNIEDASLLVAKCLWFDGKLSKDFDDDLFCEDGLEAKLKKYLSEDILRFRDILVRAINDNKLKTPLLKRDLDENILVSQTYIRADELADFLSERGIEIYGDIFAEYADEQSSLLEIAVNSIQYGKRQGHEDTGSIIKGQILYLEEKIQTLKRDLVVSKIAKSKNLHSKEKGTLLKLLLGLVLTNYEYKPQANRNSTANEITSDLALHGLRIDEDTVRKWLREATELLPTDSNANP